MSLACAFCDDENTITERAVSDTAAWRLDTPCLSDGFAAETTTVVGASRRAGADRREGSNEEDEARECEEESVAMEPAIAAAAGNNGECDPRLPSLPLLTIHNTLRLLLVLCFLAPQACGLQALHVGRVRPYDRYLTLWLGGPACDRRLAPYHRWLRWSLVLHSWP